MSAYFQEKIANDGFDKRAAPVWQMVPLNGSRSLDLVGAEGAIVLNLTPHVVEMVEGSPRAASHRLIMLSGRRPGRAVINVVSANGRPMTRLEVSVRPKRQAIKLAFNFVKDIRSATRKVTRAWSDSNYPDLAAEMTDVVNGIFGDQANIKFALHSARIVKVQQDLGDVVWDAADGVGHAIRYAYKTASAGREKPSWEKYESQKTEWDAVVAHRDASAHVNVFFVWALDSTSFALPLRGLAGETDCLCKDAGKTLNSRVVAHEIGHCLGLDDDVRADLLMHSGGRGTRLTKKEIEKIKLPR